MPDYVRRFSAPRIVPEVEGHRIWSDYVVTFNPILHITMLSAAPRVVQCCFRNDGACSSRDGDVFDVCGPAGAPQEKTQPLSRSRPIGCCLPRSPYLAKWSEVSHHRREVLQVVSACSLRTSRHSYRMHKIPIPQCRDRSNIWLYRKRSERSQWRKGNKW